MRNGTEILFVITLVVILAVGFIYINDRVSAKCFDFWPFKGTACVAVTR